MGHGRSRARLYFAQIRANCRVVLECPAFVADDLPAGNVVQATKEDIAAPFAVTPWSRRTSPAERSEKRERAFRYGNHSRFAFVS
jgi:hypothetical protein